MGKHVIGSHYMIELLECDSTHLDDEAYVSETLIQSARLANATVISDLSHQFTPYGVTAIALLAESHISIHTWPEYNYAAVDVFTCGDSMTPQRAIDELVLRFGSERQNITRFERGNK